MSMTVAQQKVKVKGSGSHLKRIRGAREQAAWALGCMCLLCFAGMSMDIAQHHEGLVCRSSMLCRCGAVLQQRHPWRACCDDPDGAPQCWLVACFDGLYSSCALLHMLLLAQTT